MYFKLNARDTAAQVDTNIKTGLSDKDAHSRLSSAGGNTLAQEKRESIFKAFIRQIF